MSLTTLPTRRSHDRRLIDRLGPHAQIWAIALFFLACCLVFGLATDVFATPGNILNLLRQAAPNLIVAVAMTFVITTGGIDLSVGSIVALTNALAAILLQMGLPWPLTILAILGTGALIGLIQGWFIAYQGIPAFIVTLAGLSILRGIALLMTQGFSVPIASGTGFTELGRGWFLGMPLPAIIAIVVVIVGFVTLSRTVYGRYVVAIGANTEAARRTGIATRRVTASVYVLSGLAAALAGIVIAARLGSGSSNAAVGFELDVIAAVVLGGTALIGGRGTIVGTLLGAMTIACIGNGLILVHISPFFTQIVTGTVILVAIWLNTRLFSKLGRRR